MAVLVQIANGAPGIRYALDKPRIRIGRSLENDITLNDSFVSKRHAVIDVKTLSLLDDTHEYYLEDLGSTNATYVNKAKIARTRLRHRDIVRIGSNVFRFLDDQPSMSTTSTDSRDSAELVSPAGTSRTRSFNTSFSRRLRLL